MASLLAQVGLSPEEFEGVVMRQYTVVLVPDSEGGGYVVTVPALPGCVTEGDTREEALTNARDAIRLFLEDLAANGEPIPEEREAPLLAAVRL
jgi:predicted RNase H-like HicB family nuclease